MKKQLLFIFGLSVLMSLPGYSQTILKPNYGLKSHETLEIKKIECSSESVSVFLSIENRIQGGAFCADKNIYILYPDGEKSRLISSSGIPVCPDSYKFKTIGEKLDFILVFPPLKTGTEWIDLIEDCDENCFSFYGITLDNDLNKKINEGFELAESGETSKALISFIDLIGTIDNKNTGIEGLIYLSVIKLADEAGSKEVAAEWTERMRSSDAPRLQLYLRNLESQGIKY